MLQDDVDPEGLEEDAHAGRVLEGKDEGEEWEHESAVRRHLCGEGRTGKMRHSIDISQETAAANSASMHARLSRAVSKGAWLAEALTTFERKTTAKWSRQIARLESECQDIAEVRATWQRRLFARRAPASTSCLYLFTLTCAPLARQELAASGIEIPEPHVVAASSQWRLGDAEMDKVLTEWFEVVEVCLTPCPESDVPQRNKVWCWLTRHARW